MSGEHRNDPWTDRSREHSRCTDTHDRDVHTPEPCPRARHARIGSIRDGKTTRPECVELGIFQYKDGMKQSGAPTTCTMHPTQHVSSLAATAGEKLQCRIRSGNASVVPNEKCRAKKEEETESLL